MIDAQDGVRSAGHPAARPGSRYDGAALARPSGMQASRRRAFTALEVMFALAILSFAILAMIAALSSSAALDQHQREVSLAVRELTRVMEQYRGMAPDAVVQAISDAGGGATTYEVSAGIGTDEKGIAVLKDARLRVTILGETDAGADLGMGTAPDLDGNGDEASSVVADYRVLPVRFEITWTSAGKDAAGANITETRRMTTVFYPQQTTGGS